MSEAQLCDKHHWERAENECRRCRYPFCSSCLVYAQGPNEPPLCVACALAISGVRRSGSRRRRGGLFGGRRRERAAR